MAFEAERVCVGCGDTEDMARLERCPICAKYFCADCAHRAAGRRFCTADCARVYFFGEGDEDEESVRDE
ncbi:MAG TPA: hypothetical protein VNL91_09050 [Thermoanaerobaculia bacterium]|nr:hypothetical protein [Thermoanaerobaculia bacterium]